MFAKLSRVNGALKIDIDGKIYEPFSFKTFRAQQIVDASCRLQI